MVKEWERRVRSYDVTRDFKNIVILKRFISRVFIFPHCHSTYIILEIYRLKQKVIFVFYSPLMNQMKTNYHNFITLYTYLLLF